MDKEKLIDEITDKILAKLSNTGGVATAPNLSSAPPESAAPGKARINAAELGQYIDHTLLKPDAPLEAFDRLCDEAKKYRFKSVCVNTSRVKYVARQLQGSGVLICAVVGFPLGAMSARAKAFETRDAIANGASEIDMVIPIGALKSGDYDHVEEDIRAVRRATRGTTILKVIIETSMLTDEEKILACQIAKKVGADFVKTSTGFGGGGATVEDIQLMRSVVGPDMGVKASGGVRDYETAVAMLDAGATRIGAGSGVAIVTGAPATSDY